MIIIHMNLGLKFLLCLIGKCFNFKKKVPLSQGWVQIESTMYLCSITQC